MSAQHTGHALTRKDQWLRIRQEPEQQHTNGNSNRLSSIRTSKFRISNIRISNISSTPAVIFYTRVEIEAYGKYPALYCTPLNCLNFTNNLSGTISEDNGGKTLTATFMLDRLVNRSDDGQKWFSKYKYDRSPELVLFTDCIMRTYVVPQSPACSFNYTVSDGFTITCDVHGVYPKAGSTWLHFINNEKQSNLQLQAKHEAYTQAGLTMYKSKFKTQINGEAKAMPGQHTIKVTVYPDVPFVNQEKRRMASVRTTVEFSISVPNQPPLFYNGNRWDIIQDRLTVNSGHTITLVCKAEGGDPPLYDIRISCTNTVQDSSGRNTWSSPGQQVSAALPISQAMDQKICYCSANHVSGQYRKQAYVTLNVLHAAEVVSFTINGQKRDIEASESETITFRCSARGNPKPNLVLFQSYSDGSKSDTLSRTFGDDIDFNIFKASCDTSGTYVCEAKNNLSIESSERTVSVRAKCRPQPCSESYGDREFSVLPDTQAEVTLCIFAYPQPHSDIRLRRMGGNNFENSLFNTKFVYTDAIKSKGNVMINMTVSIAKRSNYTLLLYQTNAWYKIPFSLVPYQKPSCPKTLNIEQVGSTFVVLSWIPAPDRGISQTFTVSQLDPEGVVLDSEEVENIENPHNIVHNITNLDPGSEFRFSLSVKNVQGITDCPQLMVNVKTPALDGSSDRSVYYSLIAIPSVIAVTLAIVLCIVIVKRKKGITKPQRQSLTVSQNSPLTLEDNQKRRKTSESVLSPVYHSANSRTELLMPARDVGYIEMRARNYDKQVKDQLNVSIPNIHVENTDRTPQTSTRGDDSGYVRCDKHFQDQSNDAVDNMNGESGIMKGEHKGKNNVGGGIECKHQTAINDNCTGSSREKCADTIVKHQCAHTTSNKEYANAVAYTQFTNARDNKEYANAISFT
ncbi:vascular cell adhesion protein 1 [Plakobranchus ocellatus]|uniref:Vascular cell adhesion protein 1 n=1 Tax=Plakobranchus ocellatus TaxID=259542 RepID=A0AAV4ANX3_9GAST|nr:vascular cell adhesion protein 1 [Plakobranchus ocellatus]